MNLVSSNVFNKPLQHVVSEQKRFFSCLTIYCAQQPSSQALHVLAVSSKLAQYAGDRSVDVDIHLCNIESILCLEREQRLLL